MLSAAASIEQPVAAPMCGITVAAFHKPALHKRASLSHSEPFKGILKNSRKAKKFIEIYEFKTHFLFFLKIKKKSFFTLTFFSH